MITSSRILPITLLIAMLRYLSEDGNDALEPFGIGMILAHINAFWGKAVVYHRRGQQFLHLRTQHC